MKPFYLIILLFLVSCSTPTKRHEAKFGGASNSETEKKWKQDTQQWIETSKWIDDSQRLEAVSSKIFLGASAYCENLKHVRSYIGVRVWSRHAFENKWQEVATSRFGLGDEVQIYLVNPGSPADKAGVKVKDVVLAVNGRPIHKGAKAVEQFEEAIKGIQAGELADITLRRGDERHDVSITPSIACKSQVVLTDEILFNLNTEHDKIKISKGLMNFFRYDQEMMAAAISHELAHSLGTSHTQAKLYGYLFAVLFGTFGLGIDVGILMLGGAAHNTFSEAFLHAGLEAGREIIKPQLERQADYIGLHIMAMAGYEIERTSLFWQQLMNKSEAKSMMSLHHISTERISEIDDTIKKVKAEGLENILLIRD